MENLGALLSWIVFFTSIFPSPREALYFPISLIGHVTCFMQYNLKLMCFTLAKALVVSLCFNYFLFLSATLFQKTLLLQPGCQSEEDMEQSLLQIPMDT